MTIPVLFSSGQRKKYVAKLAALFSGSIVALWPQNESAGTVSLDVSGHAYNGAYTGVTLGAAGIGDGNTAASYSGTDSNIAIGSVPFAAAWNGDRFSMLAWAKVDGASRWTDASTYRYPIHIRSSADATYYAVIGKSQTDHQLEWRRRSGGAIVSVTKTFAPAGPTDWFCVGMTFNIATPILKCFLYDSVNGFSKVGESSNVALTAWGANPPDSAGTTVLYAGSSTLQEWVGFGAHVLIANTDVSEATMQAAMTL